MTTQLSFCTFGARFFLVAIIWTLVVCAWFVPLFDERWSCCYCCFDWRTLVWPHALRKGASLLTSGSCQTRTTSNIFCPTDDTFLNISYANTYSTFENRNAYFYSFQSTAKSSQKSRLSHFCLPPALTHLQTQWNVPPWRHINMQFSANPTRGQTRVVTIFSPPWIVQDILFAFLPFLPHLFPLLTDIRDRYNVQVYM